MNKVDPSNKPVTDKPTTKAKVKGEDKKTESLKLKPVERVSGLSKVMYLRARNLSEVLKTVQALKKEKNADHIGFVNFERMGKILKGQLMVDTQVFDNLYENDSGFTSAEGPVLSAIAENMHGILSPLAKAVSENIDDHELFGSPLDISFGRAEVYTYDDPKTHTTKILIVTDGIGTMK